MLGNLNSIILSPGARCPFPAALSLPAESRVNAILKTGNLSFKEADHDKNQAGFTEVRHQ